MGEKSFDYGPREAPGLYSLQVVGLVLAYFMAVCTDISSTPSWAIISQVINASLILPVACFLWLLASDKHVLPEQFRLQGLYKWVLCFVFSVVCCYCVFGKYNDQSLHECLCTRPFPLDRTHRRSQQPRV